MIRPRHGIQRSRHDRWMLGVCGGIARRYGWSPNAVRLVAMILAVAIPGPSLVLSLLAYLTLGIILPVSDEA